MEPETAPQEAPTRDPNRDSKGRWRKGNRKKISHGTRSFLSTGSLPNKCSWIARQSRELQAALNTVVVELHGAPTVYHQALVQSACRHEVRALLVQRWLRQRSEKMADSDRLAWLKEIGSATDARDRCLKALGLDQVARSTLDALFIGLPEPFGDAPAAEAPPPTPPSEAPAL